MFVKNVMFAICALVIALHHSNGANILYLNGIASPSHHIWNSALVNELAKSGHNVTFMTGDKEKNPQKNVHYIVMNEIYNDNYRALTDGLFDVPSLSPFTLITFFHDYCLAMCQEIVNSKTFHALMKYPDNFNFDLIINDMTQGNCLLGFLQKFNNPPLLSVSAFSHPPYMSELVGGHHYYSYISHYALPYHGDLSFVQRFYNFIVYSMEFLNWKYHFVPKADKIMREAYGLDLPSVGELEKRTAIAFVSTTPVFDTPQPLPENVIQVAGIHIKEPKPLPKDIEDIIVSSQKGTVFFSLGSNVPSGKMSLEKRKILLDAFAQFPDYHFIWKLEKPMVDLEMPKNVYIRPWLPQSDILNHTKVKAFITHSGSLSTFESIWRGVPLIGIPFAFDQFGNIMKSMEKGVAEKLDFATLSTETVITTLRKVLEDPKYAETSKQLSVRFKDQKETPAERAVWWAEWLIRNPNCDYLKSPVLRLGFIAGNSFDIIAVISIAIFVILLAIIKSVLGLCRLVFGSSKPKSCSVN